VKSAAAPTNLLVLMADEHCRDVLGCYGHPIVKTPNLDALAKRGARFTSAYCNSPICVPSRAAFATGRYVHQIGCWDNATPYRGQVVSWGHRLVSKGHACVSIGKLHYRSELDSVGFSQQLLPLHVVDGVGDLVGSIRDELPIRSEALNVGPSAGRGNSSYQDYDDDIAAAAVSWLGSEERARLDQPWTLFVSFVCPHFPFKARREFYDLYPENQLAPPKFYAQYDRPKHPFVDALRRSMPFDEAFDDAAVRRAQAAYFGMVTFIDRKVGDIITALDEHNLTENTRILYVSDHGEHLGARGLWGKSTMYEESVAIPMIFAGPAIPPDTVVPTPVSLVDCFPTVLDCCGVQPSTGDASLPGVSLFDVIQEPIKERVVLSEYHAECSTSGVFMVRSTKYKLVYYVGLPPTLFDLVADPHETRDLVLDERFSGVLADHITALRKLLDPEKVDLVAKQDQKRLIESYGGVDAVLARGGIEFTPAPARN
jgi:choline-sulfatase